MSNYKGVAKALIDKFKGKTVTKDEIAKLCGFESARNVSNFTVLKSSLNNSLSLDNYELEVVRGIGFKVVTKQMQTSTKNGNFHTQKKAAAFDSQCQKSVPIIETKHQACSAKPEQIEPEKDNDTDLKITIKEKFKRPITMNDILNVVEKDPTLIHSLNELLKPLGKQVKYLATIVDC